MTLDEYRAAFVSERDAPGWMAIDRRIADVYGPAEPQWHLATALKFNLGGPDPLDGISVYERSVGGARHMHLVSYGMSNLYYDEGAVDAPFSAFGFEFTMRVPHEVAADVPLQNQPWAWAASFMQNLGRYVFDSKRWFEDGHYIPANGPISLARETALVGAIFVTDPELGAIDTPHGRVEFLQIVGITAAELEALTLKRTTAHHIANRLKATDPLLITDLSRAT